MMAKLGILTHGDHRQVGLFDVDRLLVGVRRRLFRIRLLNAQLRGLVALHEGESGRDDEQHQDDNERHIANAAFVDSHGNLLRYRRPYHRPPVSLA
jgi:hypothetical protein